MALILRVFLVAFFVPALLTLTVASRAAEPVAPPGSRIALTPPRGFTVSNSFKGFENRKFGASIILMEFPPGAFEETQRRIAGSAMAESGVTTSPTAQLENLPVRAFLIEGKQQANNTLLKKWILLLDGKSFMGMVVVTMPDAASGEISGPAVRAALASLRLNDTPVGDPKATLPYVFDRGDRFKYEKIIGGHAVLLRKSPPPPQGRADDASILITYKRQTVPPQQHEKLGERALHSLKALQVGTIQSRKPVTVGGLPGYEYRASATATPTGQPLNVVMVALFAADRYFILLGFGAPTDMREAMVDFGAVVASFRVKS